MKRRSFIGLAVAAVCAPLRILAVFHKKADAPRLCRQAVTLDATRAWSHIFRQIQRKHGLTPQQASQLTLYQLARLVS